MPTSRAQLERDREPDSAPDPEQQDTERQEQAEREIGEEEARERGQ